MAFAAEHRAVDRRLAPAALAVAAAGVVGAVAVHNPFAPGAWPLCPFHAATGLYCPLCGSTRAVYAALHGDLGLAATNNVLLPVWILIAVWGWLRWLSNIDVIPLKVQSPFGTRVVRYGLPVVTALFFLCRNLPGLALLAPHGRP